MEKVVSKSSILLKKHAEGGEGYAKKMKGRGRTQRHHSLTAAHSPNVSKAF